MHSTTSRAPLTFASACNRGYLKTGSIFGSVVAFVREVRLPVGIHLLTLLIELGRDCELVMRHLRSGVHDALGRVEYEQLQVWGYLEVLPRDRDVFFIDPENQMRRA